MIHQPIVDFAAGYLHEDWDSEYEEFSELLAAFIEETEPSEQIDLANSIQKLLTETSTDTETAARLEEHDWLVLFDDVSIRTVLEEMSRMLLDT